MTGQTAPVTIAVLAGGRSSRMGQDKSFVRLRGRYMIEHTLDRVGQLELPLILIANHPDDYARFGLPVFSDVIPDKGSLGGLYSAVSHSPSHHTLCVACDMPYLNPDLLRRLIELRADQEGVYDVVSPRVGKFPETMHTLYSKNCLTPMRELIDQDRLKIVGFFGKVRVRFVEEDELRRFDPALRSFVNINTPEELTQADQDTA